MSDRISERLRSVSGAGTGAHAGQENRTGPDRGTVNVPGSSAAERLRGAAASGTDSPLPASAEKWQRASRRPDVRTAAESAARRRREKDAGIPDTDLDGGRATEKDLEESTALEAEMAERKDRKYRLSARIGMISLIVACAYIIALIFGVFMTDYAYNSEGVVAPQVLSVSDRRAKAAFEAIQSQYEQCRILYQDTLVLDYRVSQGVENPMTIAPEYEALLDTVTDLSVKTDALSVETQYTQLQSMLLTWIQDDIAVYLQNMGAGLSQNNEETLGNALVDAERVYNDFSVITQNIVALGENLNGVDLTEAMEWTPEGYIDGYINGL